VLPPDEIDRLFEPFQRLSSGRGTPGTGSHGLGLSIARAIATAHDGAVTAEPRPEGGLAVSVRFPVVDETKPADPAPRP
jgi:signal transduction histidine kinase